MTEKIAFIGDVHGCVEQLRSALGFALEAAERVVLLGDYINRGRRSRTVLDELVLAKDVHGSRVTFLLGNHEVDLLNFLRGSDRSTFIRSGGLATVKSYGPYESRNPFDEFVARFPLDHFRLLESMEDYFAHGDLVASHTGLDPYCVADRSRQAMVSTSHPELFTSEWLPGWPKLVITGHYTQRLGVPFVGRHFICIDTGCGTLPGGALTCLLYPDLTFHRFEAATCLK